MKPADKQTRLDHANQLINIIASHGRRFFWYGGSKVWDDSTKISTFVPADRTARFELKRGKVYFVDNYTEKSIYTHKTGFTSDWQGFSHGGTLRALIEDMRDYITDGTPVPRWKIVIQQLGHKNLEDNIWGYNVDAAMAVREEAFKLPIVEAL